MVLRLLGLTALLATAAAHLARWAQTLAPPREADFPTLLTELAAWTLVAGCAWASALLLAAAAEAGTGGHLRATRLFPCPGVVRRWAFMLLGAAVVCAAPVPAQAEQWSAPPEAGFVGLPVPARPDGAVQVAGRSRVPATTSRAPVDRHRRVVVQPGDSLWDLAADRLPQPTDERAVAAAVAAMYRVNRDVVGPDPDLLRPGQRLVVPVRLQPDQPSQEDR